MNELLLELAKRAGLKFPSETELSPAEKKFAELIVKDIMRVVAAHTLSNDSAMDVFNNLRRIYERPDNE